MTTRTPGAPWLAVLAALALAGCQRQRLSPDEYAARTTVVRYNEALVQAYRTGNAEVMRDVAGTEEVDRIASIIRALVARGEYMETRMTGERVLATTVNPRPDGVTLLERVETWTYEHRAFADRGKPAPAKTARYRLAYNLVRRGDRFVVSTIVEHELPPGEQGR